jgi:CubicO group peptidase (beta-lactamase class C family)
LNGDQPANTSPIRLEAVPGKHWKYSGGGYTVMQQLLVDVSHQSFPELLHDAVLAPIGMGRSTYEQPLPVELRAGAATPYTADDTPVEGGFHTYPEIAAAGLWTTPTDLARFAIEIQRSLRGDANHVLSAEMTRQMLVAGKGQHGLGFPIGGSPDNPFFSHGGINAGFEAALIAYEHGDGAVVMTNAQGGQLLAGEILRGIASIYSWPDLHPIFRTTVNVDPAILATYIGVYELTPTFSITVTMENGQLMAQGTHQRKMPVFAESQSKLFAKIVDAQLEFFAAGGGQISHLILHQDGHDMRGERKQ